MPSPQTLPAFTSSSDSFSTPSPPQPWVQARHLTVRTATYQISLTIESLSSCLGVKTTDPFFPVTKALLSFIWRLPSFWSLPHPRTRHLPSNSPRYSASNLALWPGSEGVPSKNAQDYLMHCSRVGSTATHVHPSAWHFSLLAYHFKQIRYPDMSSQVWISDR